MGNLLKVKTTNLMPWIAPESDTDDFDEVPDRYQEGGWDTDDNHEYLDVYKDEDRLRGCPVGDVLIPVGTTYTDKQRCIHYQCEEYNQLSEIHCPEGCYECQHRRCRLVDGNHDEDYPDCCPRIVCEPPKFRNFSELEELGSECDDPRNCL